MLNCRNYLSSDSDLGLSRVQVVWEAGDAGKVRKMVRPGLHSRHGSARCPACGVNYGPDHCTSRGPASNRQCKGMMCNAM